MDPNSTTIKNSDTPPEKAAGAASSKHDTLVPVYDMYASAVEDPPTSLIDRLFPRHSIPFDPDLVFSKLQSQNVYFAKKQKWRRWPKATCGKKNGSEFVVKFLNELVDKVCKAGGLNPRTRKFATNPKYKDNENNKSGDPHCGYESVTETELEVGDHKENATDNEEPKAPSRLLPQVVVLNTSSDQRIRRRIFSPNQIFSIDDYEQFFALGAVSTKLSRPYKPLIDGNNEYTVKLSNVEREENIRLQTCTRTVFRLHENRRFLIAFQICDNQFKVIQISRGGTYKTPYLSVHKYAKEFMTVVSCLLLAKEVLLGHDPTIRPYLIRVKNIRSTTGYESAHENEEQHGHDQRNKEEPPNYVNLPIFQKLYYSPSRGKLVLHSREGVLGDNKGNLVVKDFWTPYKKDIKDIPELHVNTLLTGFPGVVHMASYEFIEHDGCFDYVPAKIFGEQSFIHTRIVMDDYGDEIDSFDSLEELVMAFKDYVTTIVNLYVEKRIVHRDISPRNLILSERDWTGGRRVGKLIDFEYAKNVDELTEEDAALRVGTLPFIACERIIEKTRHSFRHDLESLFYALLWLCTNYEGPCQAVKTLNFWDKWAPKKRTEESVDTGAKEKKRMLEGDLMFQVLVLARVQPYFKPLRRCLLRLRDIFFPGPGESRCDETDEGAREIGRKMHKAFDYALKFLRLDSVKSDEPETQITNKTRLYGSPFTGDGCDDVNIEDELFNYMDRSDCGSSQRRWIQTWSRKIENVPWEEQNIDDQPLPDSSRPGGRKRSREEINGLQGGESLSQGEYSGSRSESSNSAKRRRIHQYESMEV